MKKITLTIIVLSITLSTFACPFCGCGVGNFYLGLMPDFQKKFIGLRYQYLPYQTHVNGDGEEVEFSKDYYHTVELWGGISIGSKWQILAFVPYQINYRNTDDGKKNLNGISDVSVLANYKVFDKMNEARSTSQQLLVGGGFKLPTGKYRVDPNNPETELGDVNSQAGTGSVDFLLNSSYNVRFNKIGVNTTATYKINTGNNEDYRFGNRFNASSFVFYAAKMKAATFSPNVGLLYQHSATNHFNNAKVDLTGGYLAMAAAGIELGLKKITIGANVQLPFTQDFAAGQTEAKTRAMVHMSFSL
jgi:hypothetical protein